MMRVQDYMTPKVFTLRADKKMIAVQEIMSWARIRHIPVVDAQNRVVGMISHRDLLHAALSSMAVVAPVERSRHLGVIRIGDVMKAPVQTIGPEAPVQQAAQLMRDGKIGCLPVIVDEKLAGIISEYDLLGIVAGL
jgi:CBS domain-containing membrane protein